MRSMLRLAVMTAACLAGATTLPAAGQEAGGVHWPSFRGPDAAGVAEGHGHVCAGLGGADHEGLLPAFGEGEAGEAEDVADDEEALDAVVAAAALDRDALEGAAEQTGGLELHLRGLLPAELEA